MLRKQTFWGGVHPAGRKELSSGAPLEDCPPPREVVIPLLQHIGKPCTPLVKAGDHVDMGQKIGDGEGLCVPVHASVSGTVKAVEPRSHPSGQPHLAVVIENDFQNTYHSAVPPCADTDALDADALIRRIREAGLVGMGGATFPTDIKANIGKVETLIANACECEPYITADDALLCTDADRAIRGLRLLRQLLKPRRTVIAIEDNKERAVSILTDKLKQQDEVELVVLPTRYPQGAEKQLIQAVTGRQVPSGGFPKDVGCAVFNIATCASVCRAVADGEPILRRIVTITGHGIKEPKNLIVPIGTPFAHAIEAAGGLQGDVWKVIAGGPMMGRSQADLSTPVIKGTNAIVALTSADDLESPHPSCIRCGRCVSVCPMGLQPLYLYRFSRCRDVGMLRQYSILDCVECGCCAYTCPGKLPIVAGGKTAGKGGTIMRFAMSSSPHIRCGDNTRRIMLDVLIALLPTLLAGTIFFGLRCLLLAAVSIAAAGLAEALWSKLTGRYQTVEDLSAAVTGLLLALTLPATVPYWMAAVGAVFAVIVVKAAFGGLGQNIFNPALAARALLLLLFPASMTRFAAPGASVPLDLGSADVVTAATPLHSMVMPALPDVPLSEMFLGSIGGCIGEVSALALLIGGGYLVVRGVIKLRIPLSYLGTMAVLSFAFAPMEPLRWMLYSLLGGGVLLGALFMASDYATSPATPGGQVLYGIGCGVLTVLFRSAGLYPEGVTYAILLMNAASWLLERFTPTRLFGAPQRKGGLR